MNAGLNEQLLADAKLEADIQFPHPVFDGWQQPGKVFLTGSTGFLGVYLLSELLQQTSADIYCLVRAEDTASGMQRIRQRMLFYGIWDDEFNKRIVPVPGDLSKAKLGLSAAMFRQLAEQIDVIYHNGAQVNAMYPYSQLKNSNVLGTLEILRLATAHHTKPVNFISTLAIFFSDPYLGKTIPESESASLGDTLKGGYKQSKWVAEALVNAARERGLPVTVFRPGRIMGDSSSGKLDRLSDLLGNLLQACLQTEQFPDVNSTINFVPVDYASQSIVYLGQQTGSFQHNYHISNPHSINWNSLWQEIQELGYSVQATTFEDWKQMISQQARTHKDRELYLILRHLLRAPIYLFASKPDFSTQQTQADLQGSGIRCPAPTGDGLVVTYLNYFRHIGAIPAPETLSAAR